MTTALLVLSFGGPEGPDDVVPFLENVTRGRGIPRERLVEVGAHYAAVGGVSPINGQNRALVAALAAELGRRGTDVPVAWGNRNWRPFVADTLVDLARDGVDRVVVFVTSAYSSYSGCRQYREDLAGALAAVVEAGLPAPRLDRLPQCYDRDGFVEPFVDATLAAWHELAVPGARLVFTTHSIPTAMAATSGPPGTQPEGAYLTQHRRAAALVAERVGDRLGEELGWDLVFQSRSGAPHVPWLEPDVSDHLDALAAAGVPGAVLVPIGFVSDHMEVVWDLDTVAREHAEALGLPTRRAGTPGTDPRFVAMVVDQLEERLAGRDAHACAAGCCPNPRGWRPAASGAGTPDDDRTACAARQSSGRDGSA